LGIRLNTDDFWSFSLALYCRAPVAQACLSLQDRRNADVNLLLAICWLGSRGYEVSLDALNAAGAAVAPWNEGIVKQLRGARRRLATDFAEIAKADQDAIKHGILSVELECERVAQQKIVAALEPHIADLSPASARDLATTGVDRYLAGLVGVPDAQDRADMAAILDQI
jgi:uncharacterized protein (TIGR02444 family)